MAKPFADAKPRKGRTSRSRMRTPNDPTAGTGGTPYDNAPRVVPYGVDTTGKRKQAQGKKGMSDGEFQENFTNLMQDAVLYTDTELSPARAVATDYYMGRPFGNEKEGRSQAILTEVRDGVLAVLPGLVEILFAPQKVVEFKPKRADQIEQAKQATDYVQYVFMEQNPGFLLTHSMLKDGLVRKMGVVKWGWDTSVCIESHTLEHVTQDELDALTDDPDITITRYYEESDPSDLYAGIPDYGEPDADADDAPSGIQHPLQLPPGAPPSGPPMGPTGGPSNPMQAIASALMGMVGNAGGAGGAGAPGAGPPGMGMMPPMMGAPPAPPPPPAPPTLFTVDLTWKRTNGRARTWCLPPEEFVFSREARSIDDALLVAHRTEKTRSEMIALGVSPDFIDAHGGLEDMTIQAKPEQVARQVGIGNAQLQDAPSGEENRRSAYCEAYFRSDKNGDGIAELRRVVAIGPTWAVWKDTATASAPFALFCPDPEPHTILGLSWYDRLADMQLIKSSLLRATLDSAAASIFPRTWFVEGQANVTDILNTEIGAPIRTRTQGSIGEFTHTFMGREMFPLFGMMDDVIERRTGQSKGAAGLDLDALQSTSPGAADQAIQSTQAQEVLLVRIVVEQVMKPLFRGLLQLLIENQPRAEMVKLRGKWVNIDPSTWDASMDVTVNVALGHDVKRKVAVLTATLAKQEQYMQMLGISNPMVGPGQVRYTLGQILELENIPDTENYFNPIDVNAPAPPPQPPPPTPEHELAMAQVQVEQMRATKEIAIKEAELKQRAVQAERDFQLKVAQQAQDTVTKRMQIDAQFKTNFTQMQVDKETREATAILNALIDTEAQHHQMQMDYADRAAATAGAPTPGNPVPQTDPNADPNAGPSAPPPSDAGDGS